MREPKEKTYLSDGEIGLWQRFGNRRRYQQLSHAIVSLIRGRR